MILSFLTKRGQSKLSLRYVRKAFALRITYDRDICNAEKTGTNGDVLCGAEQSGSIESNVHPSHKQRSMRTALLATVAGMR